MPHKLLTDFYVHATFRAPCNIGVTQVVQVMRGAQLLEHAAHMRGVIGENAVVLVLVARAFVGFVLFSLSLQDIFYILGKRFWAAILGRI